MDSIIRELNAWRFAVTAFSTEWTYFWEDDRFFPRLFCPTWEFMMDLRNVYATSGWSIEVIPVMQFVAVRVDRADDPVVITGDAESTEDVYHYTFTPSGISQKGWFRRGIACRLSGSGSTPFAQAQGVLYCSYRPLGLALPAQEIVVNPVNDNTDWSIFLLGRGRPVPARTLDKVGAMVTGEGNLVATMEYQVFIRAFNDIRARGDWTGVGTAQTPGTGNFVANLGELALPAGITFTNFQWVETAFGVRKSSGNASRCIFQVVPLFKYSG